LFHCYATARIFSTGDYFTEEILGVTPGLQLQLPARCTPMTTRRSVRACDSDGQISNRIPCSKSHVIDSK